MGCTSSSPETAIGAAAPSNDIEKKKREREVTAGTEAMAVGVTTTPAPSEKDYAAGFEPSSSSSVKVGDLSIRYACLSHRGRDPDFPSKPNQDCYGDHHGTDFCSSSGDADNEEGNSSAAFFAVYDGHGPHGEKCSHFVRSKLPTLLKRNIEQLTFGGGSISVNDVHSSLHDAHVECNGELHMSGINDSHSGTTSVGVYVHDGRITICNVGDSRIVLGTTDGSPKIQALPLSKDHTPYRSDEKERCILSGARILSFGQIDPSTADDDDVEDPPRVWARDGNYPGTAFTRSLGDAVAERLGVCAEPEMLTLPVSPHERLLVLASDGVFDVVSNQEVVDICFRHRSDPVRACKEVIEKSHKEWLLNDDCDEDEANYDDMTCIIVYFDHPEHKDADSPPPQASSPSHQQQEIRHGKRVRQKTLRNLEEMKE